MNTQMYDAQADNIEVEDIAFYDFNQLVLKKVRSNIKGSMKLDCLSIEEQQEGLWIRNEVEDETDYHPEGVDDMGWLGYFVGRNQHLDVLHIREDWHPIDDDATTGDIILSFLQGVNNNRSIQNLHIVSMDLLGGRMLTTLDQFFKNNINLKQVYIDRCNFGEGGCRALALAIGGRTIQSLTSVHITNNESSVTNGLVDVITSLSMHPNLQNMWLCGNRLRKNEWMALATLMQHSVTQLRVLHLARTGMGDEEIEALLPALNNSTLSNIYLHDNEAITDKGWKAFYKLLCDTSSLNSTFLSNHTLYIHGIPDSTSLYGILLRQLLELNQVNDKKEVAMIKIQRYHEEFDMTPFFEWEFKVLPLLIHWFQRESTMPSYNGRNFRWRKSKQKLSSIYQFVRGMPLFYVETCLKKELDDIKAELSQMEGESSERKQQLERRKMCITERLGPQHSSMS